MSAGTTRTIWLFANVVLSGFTAWLVTLVVPGDPAPQPKMDFHRWMHEQLNLSEAQHAALESIERAYEADKQRLKEEIEDAGRRLAKEVGAGKAGSPEIEAALSKLNDAEARLQRATLSHFFAMKEHLDQDQAAKLLRWTHDSILAD